jgi:hypothetical protein
VFKLACFSLTVHSVAESTWLLLLCLLSFVDLN